MRRRRVMLVLALALMSGLVAAFSALRFMQQRPTVLTAEPVTTTNQVVVAARDLDVGHIVRPEDLSVIQWPGQEVPAGYLTTEEGRHRTRTNRSGESQRAHPGYEAR